MTKLYSSLRPIAFLLLTTLLTPVSSHGLRGVRELAEDLFEAIAESADAIQRKPSKQPQDNEVTADKNRNLIIGGSRVNPEDYPYFVSLTMSNWIGKQQHVCGGTLIHPNVVLTAAHCVDPAFVGPLRATVSAYNIFDHENHIQANVVDRIIHPEHGFLVNDIALITLDKSIEGVPLADISSGSRPSLGEELTAIGMGSTKADRYAPSKVLKHVNLNTLPDAQCYDSYDDYYNRKANICAAAPGVDSCTGDSGGPLLDKNGVQVGINSFGIGCADMKHPGVYVRVEHFATWISETACTLSPDTCPPPPAQLSPESDITSSDIIERSSLRGRRPTRTTSVRSRTQRARKRSQARRRRPRK